MAGVVVVANPSSGGGKGRRLLPGSVRALRDRGLTVRVIESEGPRHPERAAREAAADGAQTVVAVGGDGLVHGCANGLVGSETALAIVPAGNGNDFARCLGLDPKRPFAVADLVARGSMRRVDVARAEGPGWDRHFVCVAGTGFDSETNAYANSVRWLRGTPRYVVAVFRTLARFRPAGFDIRVGDRHHRLAAMLVAVGNARQYGGGMRVCPHASLDDGLLDVCVVGAMPRRTFVATFPKVFSGRHVYHPAVTTMRGAKVELAADRPFETYLDGEPGGPIPVTFTAVPRALKVVAP